MTSRRSPPGSRRCETKCPPPRSRGEGSPAGRWRGLACSGRPGTCSYRRAFARHLPRMRGRNRTSLLAQTRPHLVIGREIERRLRFLILERAVGAALEKKRNGRGIAERCGDHQRGAAAIIGGVERRAAREQKIDDT